MIKGISIYVGYLAIHLQKSYARPSSYLSKTALMFCRKAHHWWILWPTSV